MKRVHLLAGPRQIQKILELLRVGRCLITAVCLSGLLPIARSATEPPGPAPAAINALGVDLLRSACSLETNALISPYSIQSSLAMAYGGADGVTHDEMARVLHYPNDELGLHLSFAWLRTSLEHLVQQSENAVRQRREYGAKIDPIALITANRLFGQRGYEFREPFLLLMKENYAAPFQAVDFVRQTDAARKEINRWIEEQTRKRICEVIPPGALNEVSRLVLVNAIYLKAPWADPFHAVDTKPAPFHVNGREQVSVPTMSQRHEWRYAEGSGFTALELPYGGDQLVPSGYNLLFLIFLPKELDGLRALEARLSPDLLAGRLKWEVRDVTLRLPKFKLDPPVVPLDEVLQSLGMKTAFDIPLGSANFDRIAAPCPEHLFMSHVFHKTFLKLDEEGTEAAAATIGLIAGGIPPPRRTAEMKVDHPFVFAIIHRSSGACLFLGHVTDPR